MPTCIPLIRRALEICRIQNHAVAWCSSIVGLLSVALLLRGCEQHRATAQDCKNILARIVQIELREQGFRDPVLLDRKSIALQQHFAVDLAACEGRPMAPDAMTCVQQAKSTEEISHTCLR